MTFERSSGILLHPTALPGNCGIGTLGKEAFDFVDFLAEGHQKLWQIYPLGPTGYGDSPYQCFSAFAGNPLLIDLKKLEQDKLLNPSEFEIMNSLPEDHIDFGNVIRLKYPILKKAFHNFKNRTNSNPEFESFCQNNSFWLEDFSLFMSLKEQHLGKPWNEWEDELKSRKPSVLSKLKILNKESIEFQMFIQFVFFKQWSELKLYAKSKNIKIIGDIPIFVAFDSADAWANPEMFLFDNETKPLKVAGVPPDYFSNTGQLWGNPLYNWKYLKKSNYKWWINRFREILKQVDYVRLDHFRGFSAYWAVPFGEKTAVKGKWEAGPGIKFFIKLEKELGKLPIIAEDLGHITPDVIKLREKLGLPGMKILQFAFDSDDKNPYLPHNYSENSVVYTGTHDNDTTTGWFSKQSIELKNKVTEYIHPDSVGIHSDSVDIAGDLIRLAWSSKSVFALAPIQDFLRLGSEARVNTPGTTMGNWQWRLHRNYRDQRIIKELIEITGLYHR
jgi:4-alpha-glucanotransferase